MCVSERDGCRLLLFPVSFFRPSHNNKERVSVFQNQQETSKKILEEDDRLIMKSVKCVCVFGVFVLFGDKSCRTDHSSPTD